MVLGRLENRSIPRLFLVASRIESQIDSSRGLVSQDRKQACFCLLSHFESQTTPRRQKKEEEDNEKRKRRKTKKDKKNKRREKRAKERKTKEGPFPRRC